MMTLAETILMTQIGYENLLARITEKEKEYDQVRDHRQVAFELSGDGWHDNPEFNRMQQLEANLNHTLKTLNDRLDVMKFIDIHDGMRNVQQVEIGSIVKLRRYDLADDSEIEEIWEIRGFDETNIKLKHLAYNAPLAEKIMHLHVADIADFDKNLFVCVGIGMQVPVATKGRVPLIHIAFSSVGKHRGNRIGEKLIQILRVLHIGRLFNEHLFLVSRTPGNVGQTFLGGDGPNSIENRQLTFQRLFCFQCRMIGNITYRPDGKSTLLCLGQSRTFSSFRSLNKILGYLSPIDCTPVYHLTSFESLILGFGQIGKGLTHLVSCSKKPRHAKKAEQEYQKKPFIHQQLQSNMHFHSQNL